MIINRNCCQGIKCFRPFYFSVNYIHNKNYYDDAKMGIKNS